MDKLSLLAVFAHPDDESCGPGATLARYASEGVEVTLVCATRGENGAWGADQAMSTEQFASIRLKELDCACKALGIRHWAVLGYADGILSRYNRSDLEAELVRWVRTIKPTVIITHWPEGSDGHPDHRAVSRATTQAYLAADDAQRFRWQSKEGLEPWTPLKLYYAVPPDSELASGCAGQRPLTVVDATDYVEAKMQALRCHASQEQCWRGLVETLQRDSTWTESFYLAQSRVVPLAGAEDDLFQGAVSDALAGRRTGR